MKSNRPKTASRLLLALMSLPMLSLNVPDAQAEPAALPSPEATASPALAEPPQAAPSPSPSPSPSASPSPDPEAWRFSGQVMLRTEMDGRDFDLSTAPYFWTVMRTRLGVSKSFFNRQFDFFMQIQDARTFGEGTQPIINQKNLDLYQGYVQANGLLGQNLTLQIGRYELDYGNGRLFNPLPNWNYIGQSLDGGRFKYRLPEWNQLSVDLFGSMVQNSTAPLKAVPASYPLKENPFHAVGGVWSSAEFSKAARVDAYAYHELDMSETDPGAFDVSRTTFGATHRGSYLDGLLSSSLEADYQVGSQGRLSTNAWLLSAAGFVHPGPFKLGLGGDFVSGNNPADTRSNNAFAQPFGNKHSYFGFMDYFQVISNSTKNLGLNDYYLKSAWAPKDLPLEATLDLHHFAANQTAVNGQNLFGQEADFTVTYKHGDNRYTWGISGFLPGGLFSSSLFFGHNQPAFWSYLQAMINF